MLFWTLREARFRAIAGLVVVGLLPFVLPQAPAARLWTLSLLASLAPLLVIGRERLRRQQGLREALQIAPKAHQLVALELLPAAVIVFFGALVNARSFGAGLTLGAWALALVVLADSVDRRTGRGGAAWNVALVAALLVHVAPVVLAPLYAHEGTAPWVITCAVGLHPAGAALAASGLPTLQDPTFYSYTLSGVLEARPLPWFWGAAAFFGCAAGAFGLTLRAARRSPRRFA